MKLFCNQLILLSCFFSNFAIAATSIAFDRPAMSATDLLPSSSLVEGYWKKTPSDNSSFYWPVPQPDAPNFDKSDFLARLKAIQSIAHKYGYSGGISSCRLCRKDNGMWEYVLIRDVRANGEYYSYSTVRWPTGYLHYLEEHNVLPSKAFYEFVMEQTPDPQSITNPSMFPYSGAETLIPDDFLSFIDQQITNHPDCPYSRIKAIRTIHEVFNKQSDAFAVI